MENVIARKILQFQKLFRDDPQTRGVGANDIDRDDVSILDDTGAVISQSERTKEALLFGLKDKAMNRSEVTIKDESGRAEVTGGKLGNGLNLQSSGAF